MKKWFVQQSRKKKSLFAILAEKWGYTGGGDLLVPLPERKTKKVVSG